VEDLRRKVVFTVLMIAVYRFGSALRVPGVDPAAVAQLKQAANSQGALGFLNLFSGGPEAVHRDHEDGEHHLAAEILHPEDVHQAREQSLLLA